MNKYIAILVSDIKQTRRDPTLLMMLIAPLLIILVLRYGVPALGDIFPVITDFYLPVNAFFALLGAILPGIVVAFILLDEKEFNLFPVITVTPVSMQGFLAVRVLSMFAVSFCCSLLVLVYAGLVEWSLWQQLQTAFLSALHVPVFILTIAYFAKNKIEGMALLKVAMLIVILPVGIFFVPGDWGLLMAPLPAFWVFAIASPDISFTPVFLVGSLYLLLLNMAFYYFVSRRRW